MLSFLTAKFSQFPVTLFVTEKFFPHAFNNGYILFILNQHFTPCLISYLEVRLNLYSLSVSQLHTKIPSFMQFIFSLTFISRVFIWRLEYRQKPQKWQTCFYANCFEFYHYNICNVQKNILPRLTASDMYLSFMMANGPHFWKINFLSLCLFVWLQCVK